MSPPAFGGSRKPRLGFLGVGWIGGFRMEAIQRCGQTEIVAFADADAAACERAAGIAPRAVQHGGLAALLELDLDGIVIATPSAQHAQQSLLALERGIAVFCQKPLARNAAETRAVVDAARRADRLLGVDLSYRQTIGMRKIRDLVDGGALGTIFAADLVFHNAYGPDKPWFRDRALSGGGCVIDLGIHMVDLALWVLGHPGVANVSSRLYAAGKRVSRESAEVEDLGLAQIELEGGATLRLACSWNLHAGRDAVIKASFHGTRGGAALRNVEGSFHDLVAEKFDGTHTTRLASPPDDWGGRAAVQWASALAGGAGFDPEVEQIVRVAMVLDRIYEG